MKIENFKRSELQGMEHYQYASHVLRMCQEAQVEKLTAVLKPLEDGLKREDEALNRPLTKEATHDLEQLDGVRDKAYRALMKAVGLAKLSEDADEVRAAEKVAEVARRYRNVVDSNYDKESGLVKNLVADLKSAECTAAVTKLKLTAAITRLETANTAFDDRYHNRYKGGKNVDDMRALRTAVNKAIDEAFERVAALDNLDPSEKITALIQHYNNYVHDRETVIKQRETTNAKANAAKIEEQRKILTPLFDDFAKTLGVASEAVHYSGENRGSGTAKCYRLTIDGRATSIWAKVSRKKLVEVAEKDLPKASSNKKHGA
uniref:DUF6261 family protein n=1 Tax=Prevotella sp. HJM029 TaxID=1433844 RepID=UPI000686E2A3